MEAINLTPCKFRGDVLVPVKGASARLYNWDSALKELVPDPADRSAKINLRYAKPGDFVGVRNKMIRGQVVPTSFVISNRGAGNDFGWLYKRYPDFQQTVQKVYRVESVHWRPEMVTEPAA